MTLNDQTFQILDGFQDKLKDIIAGTKTEKNKEVQIDVFVNQQLPTIVATAQSALRDGQLDFMEVFALVRFVSTAIRDGLDIYSGTNDKEKLTVAREIIQYLVKELIPGDNFVKRMILDDSTVEGFINLVYALTVKARR